MTALEPVGFTPAFAARSSRTLTAGVGIVTVLNKQYISNEEYNPSSWSCRSVGDTTTPVFAACSRCDIRMYTSHIKLKQVWLTNHKC